MEPSQPEDRLGKQVVDRERALQEDRFRGFQELESMKRNHEFYVDEFSWTKLQEDQNTINNLMNRVGNYNVRFINCMIQRISRTPDPYTVDNSHTFLVNRSHFLSKMSEETCLAAPKVCRPIFKIRSVFPQTFLQVHVHLYLRFYELWR